MFKQSALENVEAKILKPSSQAYDQACGPTVLGPGARCMRGKCFERTLYPFRSWWFYFKAFVFKPVPGIQNINLIVLFQNYDTSICMIVPSSSFVVRRRHLSSDILSYIYIYICNYIFFTFIHILLSH